MNNGVFGYYPKDYTDYFAPSDYGIGAHIKYFNEFYLKALVCNHKQI